MGHLKEVLTIKRLLKLVKTNLKKIGNVRKKISKGWVIEKRSLKDGSSKKDVKRMGHRKKVFKGWVIKNNSERPVDALAVKKG